MPAFVKDRISFKRILQSATVNTWISICVRIGGLALMLPMALVYLGLEQFLVWQLQSVVLTMLVWMDFGLTPTFSRFVALVRGGGSLNDLRQHGRTDASDASLSVSVGTSTSLEIITSTSGYVYLVMSLLGSLFVGVVGTLVMIGPVEALSNPAEGWLAWAFTLSAVPFALLNGNNTAILTGCNRITIMRQAESLIGLLQVLSISAAIFVTSDLAWIAASYSFWTLVSFAVKRRLRQIVLRDQEGIASKNKNPSPNGEVLRIVWAAGWRSGIGVLFSAGIVQGSGMIMPQIATAEISAAYLVALRLMSIASQLSQAPFYSRLPAMAEAYAKGSQLDMITWAKRGLFLSLWTMVGAVFSILFIFPQVLTWINGSVQTVSSGLLVLLSLAFFAERYGGMHMQIYTLSNHVIWHWVNGITGLIILLSFFLLWPVAGPASLPLGMLIGYCFYFCPTVSRRSLSFLGQGRLGFEYDTSFGPLLGITACIALFMLVGG